MSPISTRLVKASDLPVVLEMIHALAAHHGDAAVLDLDTLQQDVMGDSSWVTLLVAERFRRLLGYAALCPLTQLQFGARGIDIHHLFVRPDVRGQGVGRELIAASIEHSKTVGCRYIMVGTHPNNTTAQKMYLAAGFAVAPAPGPRFRMKFDSV